MPRKKGSAGKGSFWAMDSQCEDMFERGNYRRRKRRSRAQHSNSIHSKDDPTPSTLRSLQNFTDQKSFVTDITTQQQIESNVSDLPGTKSNAIGVHLNSFPSSIEHTNVFASLGMNILQNNDPKEHVKTIFQYLANTKPIPPPVSGSSSDQISLHQTGHDFTAKIKNDTEMALNETNHNFEIHKRWEMDSTPSTGSNVQEYRETDIVASKEFNSVYGTEECCSKARTDNDSFSPNAKEALSELYLRDHSSSRLHSSIYDRQTLLQDQAVMKFQSAVVNENIATRFKHNYTIENILK